MRSYIANGQSVRSSTGTIRRSGQRIWLGGSSTALSRPGELFTGLVRFAAHSRLTATMMTTLSLLKFTGSAGSTIPTGTPNPSGSARTRCADVAGYQLGMTPGPGGGRLDQRFMTQTLWYLIPATTTRKAEIGSYRVAGELTDFPRGVLLAYGDKGLVSGLQSQADAERWRDEGVYDPTSQRWTKTPKAEAMNLPPTQRRALARVTNHWETAEALHVSERTLWALERRALVEAQTPKAGRSYLSGAGLTRWRLLRRSDPRPDDAPRSRDSA